MEDAQPYLLLYQLCNDQYLLGASGAVALNFIAVERIALLAGVSSEEMLDFWDKLRLISSIVLDMQYKEQERKRNLKQ